MSSQRLLLSEKYKAFIRCDAPVEFLEGTTAAGALNGEYKIIIYVKKNSSCGYIENLSFFKKQRELLLDKDNIYRVLSRKDNVIELEVI